MYSSVVPVLAAKFRRVLVRKKDPETMSTLLDDLELTLDDSEHIFELLEFRQDPKERPKNPVSPAVKARLTKQYRSHHNDTQKVVGKQADARADHYITEMPTMKRPSSRGGRKSREQGEEAMYTSDEYSLEGDAGDGDPAGFVVHDNEVEFEKRAKKNTNPPKPSRKKEGDDVEDDAKPKSKSARKKEEPTRGRKKKPDADAPPGPARKKNDADPRTAQIQKTPISVDSSDDDVKPTGTKKAATSRTRRQVVRATDVELESSSDDDPPAKRKGSRGGRKKSESSDEFIEESA
jgi:hypothetical protein